MTLLPREECERNVVLEGYHSGVTEITCMICAAFDVIQFSFKSASRDMQTMVKEGFNDYRLWRLCTHRMCLVCFKQMLLDVAGACLIQEQSGQSM